MKTAKLPNRLRKHREALGLRQRDVARIFSFASEDRISHWEKGSAIPSLVNLLRLAALYKTTPEELYQELSRTIRTEITRQEVRYRKRTPKEDNNTDAAHSIEAKASPFRKIST